LPEPSTPTDTQFQPEVAFGTELQLGIWLVATVCWGAGAGGISACPPQPKKLLAPVLAGFVTTEPLVATVAGAIGA